MKNISLLLVFLLCFGFSITLASIARPLLPFQDPKSKGVNQTDQTYQHPETRQLVALVKDAAAMVQANGEKAFPAFRVNGSRWRKGDNNMFVFDPEGNMLVHQDLKLEGKNQLDLKDINGKPIIRGLLAAAQTDPKKPEGWYHYQWAKTGGTKPVWKSSYVRLVKAPSGKHYLVGSGIYTDFLEKAFVMDAVKNAVAAIEKQGEAAYPLFKNPAGPFRVKDAYLIVVNSQGIEKVNPAFPEYVGKNVLDLKDTAGKFFIREFLNVAKNKGAGWVDYMWPKPGEKKSSRKSTYVSKAKVGNDWVAVGCGIYPDTAPKPTANSRK